MSSDTSASAKLREEFREIIPSLIRENMDPNLKKIHSPIIKNLATNHNTTYSTALNAWNRVLRELQLAGDRPRLRCSCQKKFPVTGSGLQALTGHLRNRHGIKGLALTLPARKVDRIPDPQFLYRCLADGCNRRRPFKSRRDYKIHWTKAHG